MSEDTAVASAPSHVLEPINDPSTQETCDACGPAVVALCTVILPNGGMLTLCGHHGKRWGYVHAVPESKTKGNDH
jgi:hypothetical protein